MEPHVNTTSYHNIINMRIISIHIKYRAIIQCKHSYHIDSLENSISNNEYHLFHCNATISLKIYLGFILVKLFMWFESLML